MLKYLLKKIYPAPQMLDIESKPSTHKEQRTHCRFFLAGANLATVDLGEGTFAPVIDLSYGGIRVLANNQNLNQLQELKAEPFQAKLTLIGETINTQLDIIYIDEQLGEAGVSFSHKDLDTLIYLRGVIEAFRLGSKLKLADQLGGRYQFKIDQLEIKLAVNEENSAEIIRCEITSPNLLENSATGGSIWAKFEKGSWSCGSSTHADSLPKPKILRAILFILIGAQAEPNTVLKRLEDIIWKEIGGKNAPDSLAS